MLKSNESLMSWEEIARRLKWQSANRKHGELSLYAIAKACDLRDDDLWHFLSGKLGLPYHAQRILTDFFMKLDAGIYKVKNGKLFRSRKPTPLVRGQVELTNRGPRLSFITTNKLFRMPEFSEVWVTENAERVGALAAQRRQNAPPPKSTRAKASRRNTSA